MKYLLILTILLLAIFYLNRTYAYFYDFQGSHFISNPFHPQTTEFNESKATKSAKLIVLGDSLMAGTGSTNIKNSPAYLIAQNLAGNKPLTLINYASPGVGVEDVMKRQLPQAIEEKPDYIVLMIGTNDVHNKVSEQLFSDYYNQVLNRLRNKTSAKITVINIPFLGSSKILYPPWDSIADWQISKFNQIIKKAALENELPVVDLYGQFKLQFKDSSDLYSYDQFHPSDKGYVLWGEYINKFVVSQ